MSAAKPAIIAIDGPAASGKGTLARTLAARLGFAHMDTGALYRAVALEVLHEGGDPAHEASAVAAAKTFSARPNLMELLASEALRSDVIAGAASQVAAFGGVREALLSLQRNFASNPPAWAKGAVLDGRDIGTRICPEAPLKLFITARDEIRAQRRRKELHSKGILVTYEAVLEDMRARDARDQSRKAAPLKPAPDAFVIDSSDLNPAQLLELALSHAHAAFGS